MLPRYGLDCLGIESRCTRDFQRPSRPTPRPNQFPVQRVRGFFPGRKWPGCGADYLPPCSATVANGLEIYHRRLCVPAQARHGVTFLCCFHLQGRSL
jgi:hypothetical protein